MSKAEKLFGNTEMSWKRVIVLSVVTAIIVGLLMLPPFLKDTSLQDPGITYEFWILFALFIILNCKKPVEAGVKTFVAFLISQPLIYLVQVPFSSQGWGLFHYYKFWYILTLLTFPGAILAWFVKRGNLLSVLILSVANGIICLIIPEAFQSMLQQPPHHLLSILFMTAELVFFTLLLIRGTRLRILAFVLSGLMLIGGWCIEANSNNGEVRYRVALEGPAPHTMVTDSAKFRVETTEMTDYSSFAEIYYYPSDIQEPGTETLTYTDADGIQHKILLQYGNGDLYTE